jgi:hypothetical protein
MAPWIGESDTRLIGFRKEFGGRQKRIRDSVKNIVGQRNVINRKFV